MQQGYTLPLNREQFRHALHAGLGRALQHVRAHGLTGFEDELVASCISNTAYHPQSEGSRADWIFQIVEAARAENLVLPHVIEGLGRVDDTWDLQQLCGLGAAFARRGFDDARQALYAAFEAKRVNEDWVGGDEILELDGADGWLRVARRLGRCLQEDPEDYVCDNILIKAREVLGEAEMRRVLEAGATQDPDIEHYRNAVLESEAAWARAAGAPHPQAGFLSIAFDDLVIALGTKRGRIFNSFTLPRWGTRASEDDLRKAMKAVLVEQDLKRLELYLRIFSLRPMPDFEPALLRLLDHSDEDIRGCAFVALGRVSHPEVRREALARLENQVPLDEHPLELLYANVKLGDAARILKRVRKEHDRDVLNDIAIEVATLYAHTPLDDAPEPLLWVWNHGTCSHCRDSVIETLTKLGTLPAWLVEEARLDAEEDVRARVALIESES